MSLQLQPVRVKTGSSDTEGQLVFTNGLLVAVLVRLSEDHEGEAGMWFLEAGFDGVEERAQPTFADLDEAQEWIQHRVDGH
ncbi:hypothetical protein [Methylobacterium platani]|uniref:Uncharacterized protein n=2 Tax=Methylobacterium platani TaxID=427683 RepID=A0A179S078_9HYPH|nr:hypothetical protein [Methylobacterium platani]KMO13890.1 hypothetical protein SQ03_20860 [Methylobacterium platani JCM 14648]OAS17495.1 hypothetical protein A5481_27455 [Methylobacterium platani]